MFYVHPDGVGQLQVDRFTALTKAELQRKLAALDLGIDLESLPALSAPSAPQVSYTFDFYGTRGQCGAIRHAIVVFASTRNISVRFERTSGGRLRSSYVVFADGPRPQVQLLNSWWDSLLDEWAA